MISIRPGHSAQTVLGYLNEAMLGARTLLGSFPGGFDGFTGYVRWVSTHRRTLGSAISADDLNRLLTTPTYWALLGISITGDEVMRLIQLELGERAEELEKEHNELRRALERWPSRTVMAVLDTNVLLHHHDELTTFDWHSALDQRPDLHVALWVPIVVVGELDSLKRSNQTEERDGEKVAVRTLARMALKTLDRLFEFRDHSPEFTQPGEVLSKHISFSLLIDSPGHVGLDSADDEIIDRALSLSAFSGETYLVTYDRAMAFKARHVGLREKLLEDG